MSLITDGLKGLALALFAMLALAAFHYALERTRGPGP